MIDYATELEADAFNLVCDVYGTKLRAEVEKWLSGWTHADAVHLRLKFASDPSKYLQPVLTEFALEKYRESITVLQRHFNVEPSKIIL
jgi:hypothetical protein